MCLKPLHWLSFEMLSCLISSYQGFQSQQLSPFDILSSIVHDSPPPPPCSLTICYRPGTRLISKDYDCFNWEMLAQDYSPGSYCHWVGDYFWVFWVDSTWNFKLWNVWSIKTHAFNSSLERSLCFLSSTLLFLPCWDCFQQGWRGKLNSTWLVIYITLQLIPYCLSMLKSVSTSNISRRNLNIFWVVFSWCVKHVRINNHITGFWSYLEESPN